MSEPMEEAPLAAPEPVLCALCGTPGHTARYCDRTEVGRARLERERKKRRQARQKEPVVG